MPISNNTTASINDIVSNKRFLPVNDSDNVTEHKVSYIRTHKENEVLAARLADKLKAREVHPYLAVAYSGISEQVINKHLEVAISKGRNPAKLFMFLIAKEKEWQDYQAKKLREEAAHEIK